MSEIVRLLQKQAQWQRSRKDLSWPEKIRLVEKIRDSAARWRRTDGTRAAAVRQSEGQRP